MKPSTLRLAIFASGLTVRAFAEMLDVSRVTVYAWCSGKFRPAVESRHKIAKLLGVKASEIWVTARKTQVG